MKNETDKTYPDTQITDVHSHILPAMDDGSENEETSLSLLRAAREQNIKCVIATPHFYAEQEDPDVFLARRAESVSRLKAAMAASGEVFPEIYLGAEVAYFNGMGYSEQISRLCVEGTKCILVEMPFCPWAPSMVEEIFVMTKNFGVVPYLAHIERFMAFGNMKYLKEFQRRDVIMQSNAEFFTDKRTRSKALKLLKSGMIRLLGSDCHNTTDRRQIMGDAISVIESSLSEEYIRALENYSDSILFTATHI